MCGIFGDISIRGKQPSIDDATAMALRDMLTHRGPDGSGLWRHENAILAHRRLAIIDTTEQGAQPMATPDGRYVITYNGELYNDESIRSELRTMGVCFRSSCDTETVLHAWERWGIRAFDKLRGMYAFGIYDTQNHTLVLGRDPLGVKPLYYWIGNDEVVFASEPTPIVSHPGVPLAPNWQGVSAYCSTIRCVLGEATLFAGVRAVRPGEAAQIEFGCESPRLKTIKHWKGVAELRSDEITMELASDRVWSTLENSVTAHLRSDVPVCALLSGGIDSAATSTIAASHLADLRTYCAGASGDDPTGDLHMARLVAQELGTSHNEAIITRELFARRWPEMIAQQGMPLSTPNEVAINAVAMRLRADGCIVTISGEGADEMLAGYEPPMDAAAEFLHSGSVVDGVEVSGGVFQLLANSWIPTTAKSALFHEHIMSAIENDAPLIEHMEQEFRECVEEVGDSARGELSAHLRFQRRVNLTGLLRRLDSATMLASVEGRTPFADRDVASAFEALPMSVKYELPGGDQSGGGVMAPPRVRTKLALRRACDGRIPAISVNRPKASFPLPFESWIADQSKMLHDSAFAKEVFNEAAVEIVASDPAQHWRLAWPMCNIAMWGDRWFG